MKLFSANIIKPIIIVLSFATGFGAYLITRQPDSVVEQAAEAVLKTQGIEVDLSPK